MTNKNKLLISVVNWVENNDERRAGTISCGLVTLSRNQYIEYCTLYLTCDLCPFWINSEMEKLCDTLLEYVE